MKMSYNGRTCTYFSFTTLRAFPADYGSLATWLCKNIASNLLSLRLGRDWARMSQQDCIFLKLDFIKAYDRIDHSFLLQTLQTMGFTQEALRIFKGLTCKGTAKVHINQDFTARIHVKRGVRQGCPLAPYLFTFCTQVLMDMLTTARNEGRIQGLRINEGEDLLHQLFADDTGIFLQLSRETFQQTMNTLAEFEKASGARLNLQKTTVIPLFEGAVPAWLTETGCQIATTEDRFRYLGVLTGVDVLDQEITEDIRTKYHKRLHHWTNKMLTWPAKVILCRNVLGTLPFYTLMTVGLSMQGLKLLQATTRDFLWGENQTGRKKKPLIAWRYFQRRKHDGGLGWPPLQDMADAFLLKNTSKLFTGGNDEWIKLAEAIIKTTLQTSSKPAEVKRWTTQEALLGLDSLIIKGSNTLDRLLKTWYSTKKHLRWNIDKGLIPNKASPRLLAAVAAKTGQFTKDQMDDFIKAARKARMKDIAQITGTSSLTTFIQNKGVILTTELNNTLSLLGEMLPTIAGDTDWSNAGGWSWTIGSSTGSDCWTMKTAEWRKLLYNKNIDGDEHKLNEKWQIHQPEGSTRTEHSAWKDRWIKLWDGPASFRTKLRTWRFLRGGYFINDKARGWGLGDGLCARCSLEHESLIHALWTCPKIKERTAWVCWILFHDAERSVSNLGAEDFITVVDRALILHKENQAPLLLLLTTLRTNWAERNLNQFENKLNFRGVTPVLHEIDKEVRAIKLTSGASQQRQNHLKRKRQTVIYWQNETARWLTGAQTRNPQPPFDLHSTEETPLSLEHVTENHRHTSPSSRPWAEEEMIYWDQQSHDRAHENRSTTMSLRRRRSPDSNPPMNEEQRLRLATSLRNLLNTWGSSQPIPTEEGADSHWLHYTSSNQLVTDILGDPATTQ
ncbi:hypothetical protein R1sor_001735 [Riccia sorocarpa]|uniref:Reverse transcriptase domain-containing protein n=1 Tax=Riccia sorocarpa TaxID=122646 RepID=A0ABD3GX57_9MARC